MEEEESIGQLSLDLFIDTTKAEEQIKALATSSSNPIAVVVDQSQLHDLNKTIDAKLAHIRELREEAAKAIAFKVEMPDVEQLLNTSASGKQGTITYAATMDYKDIEKSMSAAVTHGVEAGAKSIGRALAKELNTANSRGGILGNAFDGIGMGIGQSVGAYAVRSLKKNAGVDLNKIVDKSISGVTAPVKLFFTENDQLKAQLATTSKSIGNQLRKASYGLADGIIEALDARSSTIQQRINLIIKRASPDITEQAKNAYADARASAPAYRDALVNGGTLSGPLGMLDRGLRARREAAIQERAIPLVRERAAEIINSGKKINTGNAVSAETENLVVAVGGYAGARGLSGKRLVGMVQQQAGPSDQVIWVKNTDSDIPKESMGKASSKAIALATSLAKPNLRGYSKDAVEAASQAISALEKNPNLNVKFLGESGGTYVAEEAAKILQMMGYGKASYLGVGGPDFLGRLNARGKKIISPDEYLGAENARFYGKLGLSRANKPNQQILGVPGHPYENYSEAMPAQLSSYLGGKAARLSKSDLADVGKAANQFAGLDLASMEPKQLEAVSKQAYRNMQLMRQQMQVAAKSNITEISKIAGVFEKVYVDSAPESRELSQARNLAAKAKTLLAQYKSSPGLQSAMDGARVATEVGQVQSELKKLYAPAVGTNKLKYESIYGDLEGTRQALIDPKIGVKGYQPRKREVPSEALTVLQPEKPGAITLPAGIKEKAIAITAQTANLLVSGTVKVVGGAISAAHGAEQALLGRGGAKVVNTIGAAVGLSQLPGGAGAIGMLGDAAGGLAHMPLSQFAGMSSEAITAFLSNSLGAAPLLKGLAPQISAAISQALAGSATGASALIGDIAGPLLAGAGALKLGGAAAKQLPGFNQAGGERVAGNVESFMLSAMRDRKIAAAKARAKALPPGSEILDAELLDDNQLLFQAAKPIALPPAKAQALQGKQVFALPPRVELKIDENIPLNDSAKITKEVERIKGVIRRDKADILSKLKSNDPEVVEQGLVQAGVLGHGVGILSGDLRRVKDSARAQRQALREENPQIKKVGNIPGYSDLLRTEKVAEGLLSTRKGTLKSITDQVEKLGADKSLLPKVSPRLVKGAAGAGAFASVLAALTTGAQAATVGGGAIASGGLAAAAAIPLAIALGGGALGAGYLAFDSKRNGGTAREGLSQAKELLKSPFYNDPEKEGEAPTLKPQFARVRDFFKRRSAAVQSQISTEQVEAAKEAIESAEPENLGGQGIKARLTTPFKNIAMRGAQALLGFMALNLILPLGSALVSGLVDSAKKAMEDIKAERLISTALGTKGVEKARASGVDLASKYGINQREYLQDSSRLSLSLEGTSLQGQGNYLAESLASSSVFKGLDAEKRKRIATVYAQVAGKNQFYAEEAQQLAEADPSGLGEIAASVGLSIQQFRQLQKKGQVGPEVLLSNAARQKATSAIQGNLLADDPEARINKLSNSIDQLQIKAGKGILGPLATGADVASAGIKALTDNLDTLLKIGTAAMLALVVRGIAATGVLKGLSAAVQSGGIVSAAKGVGSAVGSMASGLLAANGPALAMTAGIVLLGESISSIGDSISGDKNPFRALRLEAEEATTATTKYIDKLREVDGGGDKKNDTRTLREKVDTFRKKDPNFVDSYVDFMLDSPLPLIARPFVAPNSKGSYLGQEGAGQAKKDLEKYLGDLPKREANREFSLNRIATEGPTIESKKLELIRLRTEQAASTGLDKPALDANNKRQLELRSEIKAYEEFLQTISKGEEVFQKTIKAYSESEIQEVFPDLKDSLAKLTDEGERSIAVQERFGKALRAQTEESNRIQFAIESLTSTYGNAQSKIARESIVQSTELTTRFTGSLLTGLKAALEITNQIGALNRTETIQKRALSSTQEQLTKPSVATQVTALQKQNLLPTDLADTTDEQISRLSKEQAISDNTKSLISKYKELTSAIATTSKDKAELIAKQRDTVIQESKAAREFLQNTTLEFNKSLITSQQAVRDLISANLAGKFKESLTGFNSSVSNNMTALIDIFEQAGELVRIETDRRKQQFEVQQQRLNTERDAENRNNALSSPGSVSYSSPVPGMSFSDAINIPRKAHEQPGATRRSASGGTRRHSAIDVPQSAGSPNLAIASGTARVIDYRSKETPTFGVAVEIEFIGPDGQPLKVRQGHLDPASVFQSLGLRPGGGTAPVRSGQKLGLVTDLGLNSQGIRNHIDYKVYDSAGQLIDDPLPILRQMAGRSGTSGASRGAQRNQGSAGGGALKAALDIIAKNEVRNPIGESGYYERQDSGSFSQTEAAKGFPASVRGLENIGRYQVNRQDYEQARRSDPSIQTFLPADQDKIAKLRMQQAGLPGRDKGWSALQDLERNPTFENFVTWRRDAGAEWESLRDGAIQYRGKNRKTKDGRLINYLQKFGETDRELYQQFLRQSGLKDRSPGNRSDSMLDAPLLASADLGMIDDSGRGLLAQYQQTSPERARGANSGRSFTAGSAQTSPARLPAGKPSASAKDPYETMSPAKVMAEYKRLRALGAAGDKDPSIAYGLAKIIGVIGNAHKPRKPYSQMSAAESNAEYNRLSSWVAAGLNGPEISTALAAVIGTKKVSGPETPALSVSRPEQIISSVSDLSPIPTVRGASRTNEPIPIVGQIAESLVNTLAPGAQFNRRPAEDLREAHQLNMGNLERQSQLIDETARQSTELKQFQIRAKTRKARRDKASKAREEARSQKEAAWDAEDLKIAAGEDTPERARLQADRARVKADRQSAQKIEEDIVTYDEEIKELQTLKGEVAAVDTSLLGPEQREIIKQLKDSIGPGIKLLQTYRTTATKLKKAYEVAGQAQTAKISRDFLREETRRIGEAGDAANNEQANLLRAKLAGVEEFQKRNPFDLSQGDNLNLKREADKIALQTSFNADIRSIQTNIDKAVDNPTIKAKLQQQLKIRKERFQKEMTNIDANYSNEVTKRGEDYNRYLQEQSRNILNLSIGDRKALVEKLREAERLNPQYQDDLVNLDYDIKVDEEKIRNQQQLDAVLKKRQEDKTKKGQANASREEQAEKDLHIKRMDAINAGRQNALVEIGINRRQLELSRRRQEFESQSALVSAGAAYLSAGGYDTRVADIQREQERQARELQKDEQLNAIQELLDKKQLTQEQADTRTLNILNQSDLADRTSSLTYKRQRETQQFGLGQGMGAAQAERMQSQGAYLGNFGNTFDQQTYNRDAALLSERLAVSAKLREFDEQALRYDGDREALDILSRTRAEYEALSKVRLTNLGQEYNRFGRVVKDTTDQTGNIIGKLLTGQEVSGGDWTSLLLAPLRAFSNVISNYLNSIMSQFLNNLLKPLLGDLDRELENAPSAKKHGDAISFRTDEVNRTEPKLKIAELFPHSNTLSGPTPFPPPSSVLQGPETSHVGLMADQALSSNLADAISMHSSLSFPNLKPAIRPGRSLAEELQYPFKSHQLPNASRLRIVNGRRVKQMHSGYDFPQPAGNDALSLADSSARIVELETPDTPNYGVGLQYQIRGADGGNYMIQQNHLDRKSVERALGGRVGDRVPVRAGAPVGQVQDLKLPQYENHQDIKISKWNELIKAWELMPDPTEVLKKIAGGDFVVGANQEAGLDGRLNEIGSALVDRATEKLSEMLAEKAPQINIDTDKYFDKINSSSRSGEQSAGGSDFGSSLASGLAGVAKQYLVKSAGGSNSLGGGLLSAGFGLLRNLIGFAGGGVVNPHLAPSRTDNRIIKVRDREAILTPEAVQGIGGESAVNFINKNQALPTLGFGSQFKQISERNYSAPPASQPRSMTIEYRDVGGVPMVTRDQLETALIAQTQQMQKQQQEIERARLDRQTHSVAYRQQTRGGY